MHVTVINRLSFDLKTFPTESKPINKHRIDFVWLHSKFKSAYLTFYKLTCQGQLFDFAVLPPKIFNR